MNTQIDTAQLARQLTSHLDQAGLNLLAIFTSEALAESMPEIDLPADCRSVLLSANAGASLWQSLPGEYLQRKHPIDDFTVDTVEQILAGWQCRREWLYPTPAHAQSPVRNVPLQALGRRAGWHHPSPLGIGISAEHGLWFAYRAVVALSIDLSQPAEPATGTSPCLHCIDTPCIKVCPADALNFANGEPATPDLSACVAHRVIPHSECQSACVARNTCPVAPQWRYDDQQIAYFYKRSLAAAKRWVKS